MIRLMLLSPDLNTTSLIIQDLENKGIKESQLHVLGGNPGDLKGAHLPEANVIQTSDFIPAMKRGALIGIFLSIILYGVIAIALPPNMKMNAVALIAILLFGICFGFWASTLIGVGLKDPVVAKYVQWVKNGHFLIMIDPSSDEEENAIHGFISKYPVKIVKESLAEQKQISKHFGF